MNSQVFPLLGRWNDCNQSNRYERSERRRQQRDAWLLDSSLNEAQTS